MKILILYWFIPVLLTVNFFVQIYLNPTFGITPDSFDYIEISKNLPLIKNSLFPLFYPLIIKFFNLFFHNYFFTTKFIALFSLLFCLAFTCYKKFYWKQFWILLCLPTFLNIYHYSWSETLLLPLVILFVYISHQFLNKNMSGRKFVIYNSILLTLMLFTKYSMIGILFGSGIFSIYIYFKKREFFLPIIYSLTITSCLFLSYLIANKYITGEFMGIRIPASNSFYALKLSIFNVIYNLNPFINSRTFLRFNLHYIALVLFTTLLYIPILYFSIKKMKNNLSAHFALICSASFLFSTIYSFSNVKLDILDARLLMPFTFLFLVSFILILKERMLIIGKIPTVYIAYFSIIISIANANYIFKHRENRQLLIRHQMNQINISNNPNR